MSKQIDKCKGKKCPMKKYCLRYTAPAEGWQSWIRGRLNIRLEKCKDFLEVK